MRLPRFSFVRSQDIGRRVLPHSTRFTMHIEGDSTQLNKHLPLLHRNHNGCSMLLLYTGVPRVYASQHQYRHPPGT